MFNDCKSLYKKDEVVYTTVIRLRRTEKDTHAICMQVDFAHIPYQQCGNLMYFYINHVMYTFLYVYSYLWCIFVHYISIAQRESLTI